VTSPRFSGPLFAFRASQPGARGQPRGSGAGARLRRPESAARATPRGRLEDVQKVCTDTAVVSYEYVDWFNHRRLYEACGDIPPAELETAYYRQNAALTEAGLTTT
jgi:transposase InsO family protein